MTRKPLILKLISMQNSDAFPKPPTLQDIAKLAGVHTRTVRDALQGTGRVAASTRENVRRIAQELNYEPNLLARALITGKTGRISILIGSLSEPYNVTAVQHLVDIITRHGFEAMIIQADANMPSAQTLRSSFSDGMIVVGMHFVDTSGGTNSVIRGCIGDPIFPYVVIDARRPDFMDHITVDIGTAVQAVLQMMIKSGRQRIAYVNKEVLKSDNQEVRFRTYVDLMNAAGLDPEIIIADQLLPSEERIEQLKVYFQQHGAPGAIFCHNDELATFTYRALRDLGFDIPTDTLLSGCDGVEYLNYFDTPLSTITFPWEEIGEKACQFLKRRIEDPQMPVQEHVVTGKFVLRSSMQAAH